MIKALASLCLAILLANPASSEPLKLEGMGYQKAREVILSYGWRPDPSNCYGTGEKICPRFPEIQNCSGVDPGFCNMVFTKSGRCLYIVTSGGAPEGAEDRDTHVTRVSFGASPCAKN